MHGGYEDSILVCHIERWGCCTLKGWRTAENIEIISRVFQCSGNACGGGAYVGNLLDGLDEMEQNERMNIFLLITNEQQSCINNME